MKKVTIFSNTYFNCVKLAVTNMPAEEISPEELGQFQEVSSSKADEMIKQNPLMVFSLLVQMERYGLKFTKELRDAIRNNRDTIKAAINTPAAWPEFQKLILSRNPGKAMAMMNAMGILDLLDPETEQKLNRWNMWQNNPHHTKDILGHTVAVTDAVRSDIEEAKRKIKQVEETEEDVFDRTVGILTAMFHDIGKRDPSILGQSDDEKPHSTFIGHEESSAKMMEKIMTNMGVPKNIMDEVIIQISSHGAMHQKGINAKSLINKFKSLKSIQRAIRQEYADTRGGKAGKEDDEQHNYLLEQLKIAEQLLKEQEAAKWKKLINGIIMGKGIKGPDIGKKMKIIMDKLLALPNLATVTEDQVKALAESEV